MNDFMASVFFSLIACLGCGVVFYMAWQALKDGGSDGDRK